MLLRFVCRLPNIALKGIQNVRFKLMLEILQEVEEKNIRPKLFQPSNPTNQRALNPYKSYENPSFQINL